MDPNGNNVTRLTNNSVEDNGPAWSPDGTKIAFWTTRDGNGEIYVMNANGSGQTRLTNVAGDDIAPDWQPATTADCKNGGWQNLVDDQGRPFKNQGDCVSFV